MQLNITNIDYMCINRVRTKVAQIMTNIMEKIRSNSWENLNLYYFTVDNP